MKWYHLDWRRVLKTTAIVIIWFLVYWFVTGLATQEAQGQNAPQISCKPMGRDFACVALNAENLKLLPRWILHTTPAFESYSDTFSGRAPKRWTHITADFYSYDNDVDRVQACLEVALIDGRVKLREPCAKPGANKKAADTVACVVTVVQSGGERSCVYESVLIVGEIAGSDEWLLVRNAEEGVVNWPKARVLKAGEARIIGALMCRCPSSAK